MSIDAGALREFLPRAKQILTPKKVSPPQSPRAQQFHEPAQLEALQKKITFREITAPSASPSKPEPWINPTPARKTALNLPKQLSPRERLEESTKTFKKKDFFELKAKPYQARPTEKPEITLERLAASVTKFDKKINPNG